MYRAHDGKFLLEAHVQSFYTGPADRFSWVVPVDTLPAVSAGSNGVFSTLLQRTEPRFTYEQEVVGSCRSSGGAYGSGGSGAASADPALGVPSADGGRGVDIAFRGDVGPYDAAVIKSTDPQDSKPLID